MEQIAFHFATPVAKRRRLVDASVVSALREQWSRRFANHFADRPFRVRFNNNASTMISTRERAGRLELRLHHMFIKAGERELAALADYLRGFKRGAGTLDRFIECNRDLIDRRHRSGGRSRGKRFDLERIRDAIGRAYFGGGLEVDIEWGQQRDASARRSIRLGSYSFEDRVIRIHPALDQDFVPPYVVVGVVYHELLHHLLGARSQNGRQLVHTREFRRRERDFVHFVRAERWERDNLERLLRPTLTARKRRR